MNETKNSSRLVSAAAITACLAVFLLIGIILPRAELNQDEGWYLYGSGLIHEGLRPYIDFATTQGPVMQYTYSFFWGVIAELGILGGRLLTAAFGLIAIGLAVITGRRMLDSKRRGLGTVAIICLAGLNAYQLFFFSVVKTYALAAVWIGVSFLLLTFAGRFKHICAFFAGVFIMLAAATRLSAGIIIPSVILCLLFYAVKEGRLKKDFRWLSYGFGALICLIVVMGPFIAKAPAGVMFAIFNYHAGRDGGAAATTLAYKAGFTARVVRAYYPAILVLAAVAVKQIFFSDSNSKGREDAGAKRFSAMVLLSVLLVSLLHIAAPFPYDDYQAMIFPLFCMGTVVAGAGMIPEKKQAGPAVGLLLAGLLFAGASPVNEKLFIGRRDRIWWPMREETSLEKLNRAADIISELAGENSEILTQDLYLAVEAGMKVPRGLEMGPFSYFPDWSRAAAEELNVVNYDMMKELIASTDARVAALSEYSFAIRAPEITPYEKRDDILSLIEKRFEPVKRIDDFGQAETELTIYNGKLK